MNTVNYLKCSVVFLKPMMVAVAITALACFSCMPAVAQESEIEIVNQDGERVEGARLMVKPDAEQVEVDDVSEVKPGANHFLSKSDDGILTYTDSDGKEQQIDLNRARSVAMQHSTQSFNNNGKQETRVVGKTVVVDADGQRHEIITSNNGDVDLDLPAMPGSFPKMFSAKRNTNKYMIGVHCGRVAPALQAQLGLAEDSGLLVNSVGQDSPAAAAGLQKYDVLLFADDQELLTQEDLVRVVQKAGQSEATLSLTVMRGGKEIGVDVSPVERTAEQMRVGFPGGMNGFDFDFDLGKFDNGFGDLQFKQFGPGIILGGDFDDRMDNMRQQMQQVQQQMQEMQERMRAQLEAGE